MSVIRSTSDRQEAKFAVQIGPHCSLIRGGVTAVRNLTKLTDVA